MPLPSRCSLFIIFVLMAWHNDVAAASVDRADDAIERQIAAMSDDEKIAQLLFVGFEGRTMTSEVKMLVEEWHVGGIVLYAGNVDSAAQVMRLTSAINAAAGPIPPFIAIDQEGGMVHRLRSGVPVLPSAMALGATRSPELAQRAGIAVGSGLRRLGFNMNFAPVLDVLTEPTNTAIGNRSFSDDPRLVASLGTAYIKGQRTAGIASVGKHFPGQGSVRQDAHFRLPVLRRSLAQLRERELVPFRSAIAAGCPAIMTSHLALPLVAETPQTPSTLSRRVLTGILRDELHYDGVVITDELEMRSVRASDPSTNPAVAAILAGADMILTVWDSRDRENAYRAVRAAVMNGTISQDRLRQSLRRILRLKTRLTETRIDDYPPDAEIAAEIARAAITAADQTAIRHLVRSAKMIAYLGPSGPLPDTLHPSIVLSTPPRVDPEVVNAVIAKIAGADLLITAIGSPNDRRLAVELLARKLGMPTILIEMGMPATFDPPPTEALFTYDAGEPSQRAAAAVLLGKRPAPGKMPIARKR